MGIICKRLETPAYIALSFRNTSPSWACEHPRSREKPSTAHTAQPLLCTGLRLAAKLGKASWGQALVPGGEWRTARVERNGDALQRGRAAGCAPGVQWDPGGRSTAVDVAVWWCLDAPSAPACSGLLHSPSTSLCWLLLFPYRMESPRGLAKEDKMSLCFVLPPQKSIRWGWSVSCPGGVKRMQRSLRARSLLWFFAEQRAVSLSIGCDFPLNQNLSFASRRAGRAQGPLVLLTEDVLATVCSSQPSARADRPSSNRCPPAPAPKEPTSPSNDALCPVIRPAVPDKLVFALSTPHNLRHQKFPDVPQRGAGS